jgi:hypothetical protein
MGRLDINWDPLDPLDPGPCIDVVVMNSRDILEIWQPIGLDCPKPLKMRALLDTGAAFSIISKQFATYCKLFQTGVGEVRALGAVHICGEHAGAIRFPGSDLRSIDSIRIRSADFVKERYYACLIGRDILQNWTITLDGRSKRVTIID